MIFMLFIHLFYKKGGDDNNGDFQKDIRDTMPQINKQVFFIIIILCGLLMVNKHVFDREKTVVRITSSKQKKKQYWDHHHDSKNINVTTITYTQR